MQTPSRPQQPPLRAWAWMIGFVAAAIANAIASLGFVEGGIAARAWFHAFDLLHHVSLGLAATGVAALVERMASRRYAALLGTAVLAAIVGIAILSPDLRGPATRLQARLGVGGLAPALAFVTAMLVPAGEIAGRLLGRTRIAWATLLVAAVAAPINMMIFTHLLPGAHLFLTWGTAAVIAGALHDRPRPVALPRTTARLVPIVLGVAGLLSIVVPMPPRAAAMMSHASGSVLFPFVSRIHGSRMRHWLPEQMPEGPWFSARDDLPAVEPSFPPIGPAPRIVIMVSIDAMRADVLTDPDKARAMPRLSALRDRGVHFRRAWASSNRTVASLTAVFTGKHFSQIFWSVRDDVEDDEYWPHQDESIRFPELLSRAGVRTVTYAPAYWLMNDFGVVRGFDDEAQIKAKENIGPRHSSRWASAPEVVRRFSKRLARVAKASPHKKTFFFVHFLEPHWPYNRGDSQESDDDFTRYLAELTVVDQALGDLIDQLEALDVLDDTGFVVFSDHGEAFGEHATTKHSSTLYDEIMRVPLVISWPGVERRVIDNAVSLVDVGPTMLDLYGVNTPGSFMGQSLVPLLRGEPTELTRPIAFEARPKQGMVLPNGVKVIRDFRYGLWEAYDLAEDPDELENVNAGFGPPDEELFGPLAAFFHVHELRRDGYTPPQR